MDRSELQNIKNRYGIVGNSDGLNHALDVALKVAPADISVLIIGESGVGKEAIPRLIHDNSPRRRNKYFAINCGSIPDGTIDSELFGHEKGAFTGAVGESEGYFGVANNGTIFLDEVGELPLPTQARLLRVLETGEYLRVGGTEVRKTNVRIVAATNVNMAKAIAKGRFREDLFYRLNAIQITLPPLRDRGEDVRLLFRHFALQMAQKYNMPKVSLTDDATKLLLKYKWPGNIRELRNITERISILSEKREIDADTLKAYIPDDRETMEMTVVGGSVDQSYEKERELLFTLLYELKGNVTSLRNELDIIKKHIGATDITSGKPKAMLPMPDSDDKYSHPDIILTETSSSKHFTEEAEAEEITGEDTSFIANLEEKKIREALERNNGNRRHAAKELGISDRTLYRKINQYGLD